MYHACSGTRACVPSVVAGVAGAAAAPDSTLTAITITQTHQTKGTRHALSGHRGAGSRNLSKRSTSFFPRHELHARTACFLACFSTVLLFLRVWIIGHHHLVHVHMTFIICKTTVPVLARFCVDYPCLVRVSSFARCALVLFPSSFVHVALQYLVS